MSWPLTTLSYKYLPLVVSSTAWHLRCMLKRVYTFRNYQVYRYWGGEGCIVYPSSAEYAHSTDMVVGTYLQKMLQHTVTVLFAYTTFT